jgi:16S rRNA (cytidine1402-2'-O)-methyltransferase
MSEDTNGIVYLVPTPIGNLGDITLRALEVLKSVDAIACEDTRHSRRLLTHFGINKPLERLDAHTMNARAAYVLGKYPRLAFVSDAGTPGLSDPGAELVAVALELGYKIEALPGATALVPALVLSGLSTARFTYHGFLPRSGRERRERIAEIAASSVTSAIYESPHRLLETLNDLGKACGVTRGCAVVRELTKLHEEVFRGNLEQTHYHFQQGQIRGEIVIVVAGLEPSNLPADNSSFEQKALELARGGKTARDIREALQNLGLDRNKAYEIALEAISSIKQEELVEGEL